MYKDYKMIAVLTGDIVYSSSAKSSETWLLVLKKVFKEVEKKYEVLGAGAEMHRGDGFQLGLANPVQSLKAAILIRAGLIKDPSTKKNMDARIAIGIGDYEYLKESINESSGAAFRQSGHTLDSLKKSNLRIALSSPDEDFNEEMRVSFILADTLIRRWSKADAEIAWFNWIGKLNQAQIAKKLNISQPAVSKRKSRAHIDELELLLERFSKKVQKITKAYE